MLRTFLAALALPPALFIASHGAFAQLPRTPERRITVLNRGELSGDNGRAVLGISTSGGGTRDTLGVLITAVTPGSPAEKAGLEEGNRIASINGVSLRLAREDAGEPDMAGTVTRRLTREMRKVKPGDDVSLALYAGGRVKSVKVKTVTAEDLMPARPARDEVGERAVLGIGLSSTGSKRDSLGVFVSSTTEDGPADKAGIVEGDRMASINGVDLRTPKEDLGDGWVSSSRVQRLQREVRKLKPGQVVDLMVVSGGRSRTVKVTMEKAKDLRRDGGDVDMNVDVDRMRADIERSLGHELPRAMGELRRAMTRMKIEAPLLKAKMLRSITI